MTAFCVLWLHHIGHVRFDVLSHLDLGIGFSPQYNLVMSNENADVFTWTNVESRGGIYYTLG